MRLCLPLVGLLAACAMPRGASPAPVVARVSVGVEVAPSAPEPPPAPRVVVAPDPCRGSAFDLDALPAHCAAGATPASSVEGFEAELRLPNTGVRSGETVDVTLAVTNVTQHDLEIFVNAECAFYELEVYRGETRVDRVDECGGLFGCGNDTTRLVVEPGGTLTKRLTLHTRVSRFLNDCTEVDGGPIPAGAYRLRLDAVASDPLDALAERAVAQLELTP